MPNHSIPRLRAIHIEFFSPTNTKGARVRIKDERNNVTKWLPYDYAVGDIVDQSYAYLQEQGVIKDGSDMWDDKDVYPTLVLHDKRRGYTLGVPNFETPIK
jgi:hypothetical protein|tara:strand:+ start:1647 stop:1949 length:303 start_codon:yes stop_codon:yes gene_type:complete